MATMFESVRGLIHDTASALIEKQIPKQVADSVAGLVSSSFAIVEDVLKIVQELTEPETAETKSKSPPSS